MRLASVGYKRASQSYSYSKRRAIDTVNTIAIPDNWTDFARICKIRSGAKVTYFNPYDYQEILVNQIETHPTTVITKTRQLGLTETVTNYFLWKACKNEGYLAVIFSKSQTDTSNIAKRIRRQIDSLCEFVHTKTDSLTDIEIAGGGRILFRNSTPNGARGLESVSDILYDEASFVDEIEEIYAASIPTTTVAGEDARIIILSTPNGQSGWYWDKLTQNNGDRDILDICDEIKAQRIDPLQYWTDDNGWSKFIIHWLGHPKYSQQADTYLSEVKRRFELPEEKIEQEYNLSFTHSEVVVFPSSLIRENAKGNYEELIESDGIYFMGIDTSLLGNDYTVAVILKLVDGVYYLVKMYRQRKKSHEYNIYHIAELINQYKPVIVGIETNSHGQIYYEQLLQQCPNTELQGIKTTANSKPVMVNKLQLAMEQHLLLYPTDKLIIEEMLSFRQVGTKLEAIEGKHDDIIMALAFSIFVTPIQFNY